MLRKRSAALRLVHLVALLGLTEKFLYFDSFLGFLTTNGGPLALLLGLTMSAQMALFCS